MTKEERVTQTAEQGKDFLKKSAYDLISISIIVIIIVASLDAFGFKDIHTYDLYQFAIEWAPFFLASVLLNSNLYEKGKYVAKNAKTYIDAIKEYSTKASALNGEKLKSFPTFCNEKNEEIRRELQENALRPYGISWDDFNQMIACSEAELHEKYDDEIVKVILKTRKIKIAGYKVNYILGNNNSVDRSDLGPTEEELSKNYKIKNAIYVTLSTLMMTFISIKDIVSWGWAGLLIVLFKTGYTFARAYMSYFKGYSDVAIKLTNQIIRKVDIFKEYDYWFELNKPLVGNKK